MTPQLLIFPRAAAASRWLAWALAVVSALGAAACSRPPASVPVAGAKADSPAVVFQPSSGAAAWRVHVEVARTAEELSRGLMFRRELAADDGMLFIFPASDIRRFWMRNTYIPLDMVFLDSQRNVVGIEENTVPLDETSRGPDAPAQFVVEVRGGAAKLHGLGVGAKAEFQGVK